MHCSARTLGVALRTTHKTAAHGEGTEDVSQDGHAHGRDSPHTTREMTHKKAAHGEGAVENMGVA